MHLAAVAVSLLFAAIVALAGCNEQELKTVAQAETFIADAARGKSVGDWKLAESGASPLAQSAWRHQAAIEGLGKRVRDIDSEWACDTIGYVKKYGEAGPIFDLTQNQTLSTQNRQAIIDYEERKYRVFESEVSQLIDLTLQMAKSDFVEAADTLCSL